MFYSDCIDFQANLNDTIINGIYKPFLGSLGLNLGDDYSNVYINFPPPSIESNADKIIWLREGAKLGFTDRALGRLLLGIRGKPPALEEVKEYLDVIDGRDSEETPRSEENRTRDGRDPENQPQNQAEDVLDKLMEEYSAEELMEYLKNQD